MAIPEPTPSDLQRDAEADYAESQKKVVSAFAIAAFADAWIRRAEHERKRVDEAERTVTRLNEKYAGMEGELEYQRPRNRDLADVCREAERQRDELTGKLKSAIKDATQAAVRCAELAIENDELAKRLEIAETALYKLDELDWCIGYELIESNQTILFDALDLARKAIHGNAEPSRPTEGG